MKPGDLVFSIYNHTRLWDSPAGREIRGIAVAGDACLILSVEPRTDAYVLVLLTRASSLGWVAAAVLTPGRGTT